MPARKPVQKPIGRRSGTDRRIKQVEPTLMGVNPVTGDRNVEMYLRKTKRGLQLKANARAGKERRIGSVDRRVGLADRKVGQERRSGQDRRKIAASECDFARKNKLHEKFGE